MVTCKRMKSKTVFCAVVVMLFVMVFGFLGLASHYMIHDGHVGVGLLFGSIISTMAAALFMFFCRPINPESPKNEETELRSQVIVAEPSVPTGTPSGLEPVTPDSSNSQGQSTSRDAASILTTAEISCPFTDGARNRDSEVNSQASPGGSLECSAVESSSRSVDVNTYTEGSDVEKVLSKPQIIPECKAGKSDSTTDSQSYDSLASKSPDQSSESKVIPSEKSSSAEITPSKGNTESKADSKK